MAKKMLISFPENKPTLVKFYFCLITFLVSHYEKKNLEGKCLPTMLIRITSIIIETHAIDY